MHTHHAWHDLIQVLTQKIFELLQLSNAIRLRDTDTRDKVADGSGSVTAAAHAGEGWHARIVPAFDVSFFNQLQQLAFAEQRIREREPVKLVLPRRKDAELFNKPVI